MTSPVPTPSRREPELRPPRWSSWWRHLWLDAADARRLLGPDGLARLEAAVRESESRHRGELRVCIEGGLGLTHPGRGVDVSARALDLFGLLRVWDTAQNNGVLIYLLLAERRIEVLADRGLADKVPAETWAALTHQLGEALAEGQWEAGLMQAIDAVSTLLRAHFPLVQGEADVNELPDAVVLL